MSICDGLGPYVFPRKLEKDRAYEKKDGWEGVCFSPELVLCPYSWKKTLLPNSTLIWRVSDYVSRQGKGVNGKNKITNFSESYYHF